MVDLFANVSRDGPIPSALLLLCCAVPLVRAESLLQVESPENGMMVNAGADLTVTIRSPAVVFQSVSIVGDGPFALSTASATPPYRFSYRIAAGLASGRYRFKAAGTTASGAIVYSDPVEVDIEQPEQPTKLESESQLLYVAIHENANLVIQGIFANGPKVELTRSTRITYRSDRPAVVEVSNEGGILGANTGKAKITVKYADKILVLPVVITPSPPH